MPVFGGSQDAVTARLIFSGESRSVSYTHLDVYKRQPGSVCSLNALAIDEPLEYAKLYLDGTMQILSLIHIYRGDGRDGVVIKKKRKHAAVNGSRLTQSVLPFCILSD